ncbi:uncharacterized protein G2W53_033470 [Senna tora]|uniref:Transposase n=1 Tax=Senna tora TaxID=362788 RepID=A0A834WCV3_9FABA|nr:uncharacterized protein G2W53_033470 [Senna tora]
MVHDACGFTNTGEINCGPEVPEEPNMNAKKFYELLQDAETELYPGCQKVSKLSFIVRLLHLKCLNKWSNRSMDDLLSLIKEVLPNGASIPNSYYEAKKVVRDLGLDYTKIDACIRHQLHPIQDGQNFLLPAACYALSSEEKLKVCNFLADLKVPDAFSSDISRSLMSRVKGRGGKSGTRTGNERDEITSRFQIPPIQHNNEGQTSVDLGIDDEPCLTGPSSKRNVRGRYRSKEVEKLTKNGELISIDLAVGVNRAVGDMARLIANYLGHVLRTTVSFRDGTWDQIAAKHGPAMFTKMKYGNDEDRLKHQPDNVSPEDWRWLVHHFGTPEFKAVSERNKRNRSKQTTKHICGPKSFAEVEESMRDPETGELAPPDRVWEKQHARKKNGEWVWSDPQSQEIHGRIQQLVNEERTKGEDEPHMNRDEILQSVLGERSGHVRGKGCGANPIGKKRLISEYEVEARVSSAVESARAKLRDELLSEMQDEIDRRLNAQLDALMGRLQQGQFQATGSNSVDNSPTGAQNQ